MKTKIIEILNTIARGETPPKKIVWKDKIYIYDEDEKDYYDTDECEAIFDYHEITDILNDEVEILETTITYKQDVNNCKQDDISKLPYYDYSDLNMEVITQEEYFKRELQHIEIRLNDYHNKINEIIDKLNGE